MRFFIFTVLAFSFWSSPLSADSPMLSNPPLTVEDDGDNYSLARAYYETRGLCRMGPAEVSKISCEATKAYGELLIGNGYCFGRSEQEWYQCALEGTHEYTSD